MNERLVSTEESVLSQLPERVVIHLNKASVLAGPDLLSRTDTETGRHNLWNVLLVMAAIFQRMLGRLRRPGVP